MKNKTLRWFSLMGKISIYLAVIVLVAFNTLLADSTRAQGVVSVKDATISISMRNVSLRDAFRSIEEQSDYTFVYSEDELDPTRQVTLNIRNKSVEHMLLEISKQAGISFRQVNDRISVKTLEKGKFDDEIEVIIQKTTISGVVSDENGESLPGATVLEKGTTNGTITDVDGKFQLEVADNAVLLFSFVGYQNQEIAVNGQSTISIQMAPDTKSLEEVVVVGYGTMKKSDLTGSISSVGSDDFNQGPQLATQQLIQGKVAGVNISKNSGKPGGSNTVRIRGGTSISASNEPLYVIDGVPISTSAGVGSANLVTSESNNFFDQEPINPLMTLNPNDIESVIVLKDASATAIYGSRGANGVIMITTKKGRQGKAQVTYDFSTGISKVSNTLDVLTADEFRAAINDLELPLDDKGANTNWQEEIYRTASQQNHYLSMAGGSDNTTYRASLGYGKQQGIMLGSNLSQANARVNINHSEMEGKLDFDLRMNYGENAGNQAPISNTVGSELGSSMNYEALVFNPTYPVKDANGDYNHVPPFRVNPVSFSDELEDVRVNRRFIGNFATTYKIIEPLSFKVNLGYTRQSIDRNRYISKDNPLGQGFVGYAGVQKLADYSKLLETTLSFNKTFGAHKIDAVVGYSYQYFVEEGTNTVASGFLSNEFKWYSLQAASTVSTVSSFIGSNTLISTYGRINYNFDNRYFFTGTVRRDGSSRFGSGNKWGTFPSAAVSWRVSQERFFDVGPISDLKVRASYGITGNQEIGNLNSITTLGASTSGYLVGGQRITIVLPQQYANPDLQWEQTAQLDVGLNFGLFQQRLYGSFDYYEKKTTELLLQIAVPSPSVVSTQLANVGSVENKGVEVELGAEVLTDGAFKWNTSFNYSRNRNKVLKLSNGEFSADDIGSAPLRGAGLSGYSQLITPGKPLGTFYGQKFIGVIDGVEQFAEELQYIGNARPDFTFGWSNNFTYKNLSLVMNMRGSVGNDVHNLTANNLAYLTNLPGRNVLATALETDVARDQPKEYSSKWIEDASFLRMDNVTLSYNVPVNGISFLSNARIYLTGQNLFVITGYSGLDPEVNSEVSGSGVAPIGIDYLSYPRARTFIIGASVSF
ncbi:TonB-dependent receptor [Marinoscillum sp. MHG1-6]|uniref:TonB-dependent receptor n=1 Tax=Marinoscillum sp. MHG1-6 TaxID=2959627 RepID=UPI0021573FAD|nr:TonB-dependent receptor [Marinoscillum sp. MHG1-6]